jgi:hypothetical protein
MALCALAWSASNDDAQTWREAFALEVDRQLEVPEAAQQRYMALVDEALAAASLIDLPAQAVVVVDRSDNVQAAAVLVGNRPSGWQWLGAVAVSTGCIGDFEHFRTPLGVFAHSLDNPDFRAEGTVNAFGIRGYGARGMRIFDFGWIRAERGWGDGGESPMRLQMHATDPTWPGRYLVVVDSQTTARPIWAA